MEQKIEALEKTLNLLAASIQDLGNSLDRHSTALEDHTAKLNAFLAFDSDGNSYSDFSELSNQIEELKGAIEGLELNLSQ